jgi:hypothetical protein
LSGGSRLSGCSGLRRRRLGGRGRLGRRGCSRLGLLRCRSCICQHPSSIIPFYSLTPV